MIPEIKGLILECLSLKEYAILNEFNENYSWKIYFRNYPAPRQLTEEIIGTNNTKLVQYILDQKTYEGSNNTLLIACKLNLPKIIKILIDADFPINWSAVSETIQKEYNFGLFQHLLSHLKLNNPREYYTNIYLTIIFEDCIVNNKLMYLKFLYGDVRQYYDQNDKIAHLLSYAKKYYPTLLLELQKIIDPLEKVDLSKI